MKDGIKTNLLSLEMFKKTFKGLTYGFVLKRYSLLEWSLIERSYTSGGDKSPRIVADFFGPASYMSALRNVITLMIQLEAKYKGITVQQYFEEE